jgi:hypothetical protein
MSGGWWILGDGREEMSFKRVPGGWLFAVPFQWPRASYVVDDTGKQELARRLRWIYRINFIATIIAVSFLIPVSQGASEMWVVIFALLATSIVLSTIATRMAVRPIISGMTPVAASISRKEAIITQAATLSHTGLATMEIASLVLFGGMISMGLSSGWDSIAVMGAILFGACSAYFPVLWIVKTRTEPSRDTRDHLKG